MIVCPLHAHYSSAHLERVAAEMRRLGAPAIRAHYDAAYGVWLAQEGTHRLRAALLLGLAPVMIPVQWPRSRRALERARFAAIRNAHVFGGGR